MADPGGGQAAQDERKGMTLPKQLILLALIFREFDGMFCCRGRYRTGSVLFLVLRDLFQ